MKRIVLIITALFALNCYAQEPLNLIMDKAGVYCYDYNCLLTGQGDEHYVCMDYTMLNSFTRICQDIITCVSKNGTEGRKITVERSMDYNLLAFYEGESNIYCLYSNYEYSAKSYSLYLNTIPKDATVGTWNPEKVISFHLEKREDVLVGTAVSPDQTKAGVIILQVNKAGLFQSDKSDKLKGSAVLMFGEDGLLWSNPLEIDLANSILSILDIAVSNTPNVYVAISSYNQTKSSNMKKENEMLHLFEVGAEETRTAEVQPDFGNLLNGKLLLCASGDISIGGYYQKDINQKSTGAYMATFDGKQMEGNLNYQPFPQAYYDYKHPKFSKKGEDFEAVPVDFKEFSNGTKVLLGEPRTEVHVPNFSYTLFGNILVSFADKSGQFDDFQMIQKDQALLNYGKSTKFYQSALVCFNTFLRDNKLYLFYNDNIANHTGKSGQALVVTNTRYDKKCGLYTTIESDHRISDPIMFVDYKNYKCVFYRPLFIDEDGLLVYNTTKLYGALSKLMRTF
jgi:hypothetical protein